jgi:hypothetical protein
MPSPLDQDAMLAEKTWMRKPAANLRSLAVLAKEAAHLRLGPTGALLFDGRRSESAGRGGAKAPWRAS